MNATALPTPNRAIIAWALEESGHDRARVAKRLAVKPEKVEDWIDGHALPTLRQLHELALFLQRPLSLFFQDKPPRTTPLGGEYRRLKDVKPGAESPELRLAIRQMLARREIAINLNDELGYDVPAFQASVSHRDDPKAAGRKLRALLKIQEDEHLRWTDAYVAWREWRTAIEELGVLVFMFPKVELSEVRGISLVRKPMPVVAVNTKESVESRAYTALHELVHLMLVNANEEGAALADNNQPAEWEELERFAEKAASYALIDEDVLSEQVRRHGVPSGIEDMRKQAIRFKVTPLAYATRLWQSELLTWNQYDEWRGSWRQYVEALPKKTGGFATPVDKALGRGGRSYAQLVLEAFDTNRITSAEATRYLNLRIDKFDTLRERLAKGQGEGGRDE